MHPQLKSFGIPTALLTALLLPGSSWAADTRLVQLQQEQAVVDGHFKEANARLGVATEAVAKASAAFKTCKNPRLQIQFNDSLSRMESARRRLERGRREAQALRRDLEAERTMLEASRRQGLREYRGKRPDPGLSASEEAYVAGMSSRYLKPLDSRLIPLIDDYAAGMTEYSALLERYAAFCAQPTYSTAGGAAFVAELAPAVEGLSAKAETLAKVAAESRTASKAMLSSK